jgi:uncharacterized damage-inducible protein DinB
MTAADLLILDLEEVRRRSIILWRGIPGNKLEWRPDAEAMSCIEMVRHVLEGEWLYHQMLKSGGGVETSDTRSSEREWTTVDDEIEFARSYRKEFLDYIRSLSDDDMAEKKVDRSERGYVRPFGDFVLRIGYHESVHAGQMLAYLRTMGVPRPNIWD